MLYGGGSVSYKEKSTPKVVFFFGVFCVVFFNRFVATIDRVTIAVERLNTFTHTISVSNKGSIQCYGPVKTGGSGEWRVDYPF